MRKSPDRPSRNQMDATTATAFAIASQVGLGIVLPLVAGGIIGWYLDGQVFHNHVPLATLVGLLLGLITSVYGLVRLISLLRQGAGPEKEKQRNKPGNILLQDVVVTIAISSLVGGCPAPTRYARGGQ